MMNAKKAGKMNCVVKPVSKFLIEVLNIMKKEGYIDYKIEKDGKFNAVNVSFIKLNSCRVIKPHYYVKKDGYQKFVERFLPSRHLGIILVSTSKGLMTHKEAIEKNLGGSLIAFCY